MKIKLAASFSFVVSAMALISPVYSETLPSSPETTIWFDTPAKEFTESSPMGNGRLGAMMFGGVDEERIVLNESSVWSGSRQDADRPDAYKVLPTIQKLLLEGKNPEAEALVNANFTCAGPGSGGKQYGCYQVLGNLHLSFPTNAKGAVTNYRRELNLNDAITRLKFSQDGVEFDREMFVSKPDEVMVLRLSANKAKQISFTTRLDRPERFETTADGDNGLLMTGQLDNGTDGKGLKYVARVRVLNHGGSVSTKQNVLTVSDADEVVLLIAAGTDYQGFAGRQTKDPLAATLADLTKAASKSFDSLREAHVADYQKYFNRVSLHLDPTDEATAPLPILQRLKAAASGAGDPNLAALQFNFGRYLLISSSRAGGLPANLQGIWAQETSTPWTGDWHLDVNVQMNYWPAEVANLSDLTDPLFSLIASLQEPGAKTARDYYHARGWVAHVITNPWGFTSPGESASWGSTTCGSAWLCQHLYDHFLFTKDKEFLKSAYPIMRGAAEFVDDLLIEEPTHHWLVVAPSNSPENHFEMADGQQAAISMGPTMMQQLVRYLFGACIESSQILGIDEDFRKELIAKRDRLSPTQIGTDGRVMEWLEQYKEPEPKHRHVSHLWGLYPGDEISPASTPALANAARKSLEARGDDGVGWSLAFKAALWARLGDGNHAWGIVRKALAPVDGMDVRYDGGGGVYPNLFDACPPFQIDANFGLPAAIAEMVMQSQPNKIQLLPALPEAWKNGKVTGLRARGGFQVDLAWQDGKLVSATIHSDAGEPCSVSYNGKTVNLKIEKGASITLSGNELSSTTPAWPAASAAAIERWQGMRFGMFIHWGPVTLKGTEIGWSRGTKDVSIEEYDNLYKRFDPEKFNADEWVSAAKAAGMKYIVLTCKHHDGFCLWDTQYTDYNIMHTPFHRDVVKELSEACKKQGIAFGAYYSVTDWYHPGWPVTSPGGTLKRDKSDMDAYEKYLQNQIRELITNYGPLITIWNDVQADYGPRGADTIKLVRSLQPDILINDRTGAGGDYDTPEQRIGGFQNNHPWESCMTICRQWAWKPNDNMKSLPECLQTLISCAGGDGNLLLNVGPTSDGVMEPRQVDRLKEMGDWMAKYGQSIYGTRGGPWMPTASLASTRAGNTIYIHVMKWDGDEVVLPGIQRKIIASKMLTGGVARCEQDQGKITLSVPAEEDRQDIDTIIQLTLDGSAMDIAPIK